MCAKCTFVRGLLHRVEKACIVWTRLDAVPAANAEIIVDHDNSVSSLERSFHRTNLYARWVITVIADERHGGPFDVVGESTMIGDDRTGGVGYHLPNLHYVDPGSVYTNRHVVLILASHDTGLTSNAAAFIYHHYPVMRLPYGGSYPRKVVMDDRKTLRVE